MIELAGVLVEDAPGVWPVVEPMIAKALKHAHGEHTTDTLLTRVLERNMQLWVGHDSGEIKYAALTMVTIYPTGRKVAEVTHMGGKGILKALPGHTRQFEEWAKSLGCDAVAIVGRRGWEKIHPEYKPAQVTLVREL